MCTYAASNAMSKSSSSLGGRTFSAYNVKPMDIYCSVHTGSRKRRESHSSFQCPAAFIFLRPVLFQAANTGFLEEKWRVKTEGMNGHYRRALENNKIS